jgi:hypothetical protein
VGVGDAVVSLIESIARLRRGSQRSDWNWRRSLSKRRQGVVGGGAGAVHGYLGRRIDAIFSFGKDAAVEVPGGAHDFDGQHLLDRAEGV